jgi:hypothetical protein
LFKFSLNRLLNMLHHSYFREWLVPVVPSCKVHVESESIPKVLSDLNLSSSFSCIRVQSSCCHCKFRGSREFCILEYINEKSLE